jgi:CHRD domain
MIGTLALAVALSATTAALAAKAPNPNAQKPAAPTVLKVSGALNIGQVKPRPKATKAGAAGRFTATLEGTTLKWKLTYNKQLSGAATAAHIHVGARRTSPPNNVVIPLCGPCTTGVTGTTVLTADQVTALKAGQYYVNVHTDKNPGGEIRGQLSVASA